jgi:sarcosine oxidase subunit gamma
MASNAAAAATVVEPAMSGSRYVLQVAPEVAARIGALGPWRIDLAINRSAGREGLISARLGPDEWLLLSAEPASAGIQVATETLGAAFHSLVEVSARDVGLIVSGPGAREMINSGCPLDLDDAAFPVGAASRTLLAKAEIVLIRLDGPHAYRLEARRSFGPYVRAFLEAALA